MLRFYLELSTVANFFCGFFSHTLYQIQQNFLRRQQRRKKSLGKKQENQEVYKHYYKSFLIMYTYSWSIQVSSMFDTGW